MSDQEVVTSRTSAYAFVPAKTIDESSLIKFAATVWPERPPYDRILSCWWRRAEPTCAIAAVHEPTGVMAGLCAGRPSEWIIAGRMHPAVAICDWYVTPEHAGKLLGKRLVRHFDVPGRFMYAFSMSDAAIAYLKRLGWVGPYTSSFLVLPLPRVTRIPLSFMGTRNGLDLHDHDIGGGETLGALGSALDRIETRGADPAIARMRRGAAEWSWRLSICGRRHYRFCVAHQAGVPAGYVVVRRMTPGSSRLLGKLECAIITDLVAANDDPQVIRALAARAAALAGEMRSVVGLICTTSPTQRRQLAAMGFVSSGFPLLGRFLERRAPVFMWAPRGPASRLEADGMAFTFADSDVDLAL